MHHHMTRQMTDISKDGHGATAAKISPQGHQGKKKYQNMTLTSYNALMAKMLPYDKAVPKLHFTGLEIRMTADGRSIELKEVARE